jgi:uncharacterized membrane protein YbaN (DUF454 family)
MTKWLWKILGLLFVGCAYIGAVTPGVPTTTFVFLALWAFAKGSPELHQWLLTHPRFSPYIIRWRDKRIFPTRAKIIMTISCIGSLIWIWVATHNIKAIIGTGLFMLFWLVWAYRYPGDEMEYWRRRDNNRRIGWLK